MIQQRPKVCIALSDDNKAALDVIKAYYGFTSNSAALRCALTEHAKHIKAEAKRAEQAEKVRKRP